MPRPAALSLPASLLLAVACASPALAQPMWGSGYDGWGGGWGGGYDGWGGYGSYGGRGGAARRGGSVQVPSHIEVSTWRAADALPLLGKGRIVIAGVEPPPQGQDEGDDAGYGDNDNVGESSSGDTLPDGRLTDNQLSDKLPVYEAAVVDALIAQGYDTQTATDAGQIAQVAVSHMVVVPAEVRHNPVSGEVSTMISNRGSGVALGLGVDLSKPAGAVVSTRMDVRIRDRASGKVLWEGHAEGMARERGSGGEDGIDDGGMAARLARALFARFPEGAVVVADADAPGGYAHDSGPPPQTPGAEMPRDNAPPSGMAEDPGPSGDADSPPPPPETIAGPSSPMT
ncbi:MAG: DUF4136 domain-containing protein [Novosphingobium aromaticivorans]|nr:DUF4136 domain-containing protein [Novosphingobium aromaticivorans]